jgi:hypothetical protein
MKPGGPQVTGSKRVLLWPPGDHDNLYVSGSSSPITQLRDPAALARQYPRFAAAAAVEARLRPGDCLYIPALWFHNVASETFAVSVNLFWRHLPPEFYERKDLYGNRDLVQVGARAWLRLQRCGAQGLGLRREAARPMQGAGWAHPCLASGGPRRRTLPMAMWRPRWRRCSSCRPTTATSTRRGLRRGWRRAEGGAGGGWRGAAPTGVGPAAH